MWHRENAASRRITAIPGVGVLTATAVVATMGNPGAFQCGREFAAWLGLVPRHTGTGGRVQMLGITKCGDKYVRTLLVHGARSVLARGKAPSAWQLRLTKKRPSNVVAVALANKMARTIWALLAHDRDYDYAPRSRGRQPESSGRDRSASPTTPSTRPDHHRRWAAGRASHARRRPGCCPRRSATPVVELFHHPVRRSSLPLTFYLALW